MASMDGQQYERFVAFNNARLNNRSLKKVRRPSERCVALPATP